MDQKLFFLTIFSAALLGAGAQNDEPPVQQGLIGAYYGEADLTRIKEAEILTGFDKQWDEETGHGSEWSGRWQGMLRGPVTGNVRFILISGKRADLSVGPMEISAGAGSGPVSAEVPMSRGAALPMEVRYYSADKRPGGFRIEWQWADQDPAVVPAEAAYFTESQALRWNWIPEPDPDTLDFSRFPTPEATHVIVAYEPGRFGGWPANNGIWSWDDGEILVGLTWGYYRASELHHSIDEGKPAKSVLARSRDGGATWQLEDAGSFSGDGNEIVTLEDPVRFDHPDLAIRCRGNKFRISYDRGARWQGPYRFPDFGRDELTSRTDYIVTGPSECLFFLSTEAEEVQARLQDWSFCASTVDGGKSFDFLSWLTPQDSIRAVMPSSIRISPDHIVTALRRRFDEKFDDRPSLPHNWIDVYESTDGGQSWQFLSKVADTDRHKRNGNPPSLVRLKDGRLVVTYGFRGVPYGIRAKISTDNGRSWGPEIHLRNDARTWDIGYTRSVQRPDGKIVTIYYYTTESHMEQHIAATIWDPDVIR